MPILLRGFLVTSDSYTRYLPSCVSFTLYLCISPTYSRTDPDKTQRYSCYTLYLVFVHTRYQVWITAVVIIGSYYQGCVLPVPVGERFSTAYAVLEKDNGSWRFGQQHLHRNASVRYWKPHFRTYFVFAQVGDGDPSPTASSCGRCTFSDSRVRFSYYL